MRFDLVYSPGGSTYLITDKHTGDMIEVGAALTLNDPFVARMVRALETGYDIDPIDFRDLGRRINSTFLTSDYIVDGEPVVS
jgi:hypothetical protein